MYTWSQRALSSDINNPSAFIVFALQQILIKDTKERRILALQILKRLRSSNQLLNNAWKKNTHMIVVCKLLFGDMKVDELDYDALVATVISFDLFRTTLFEDHREIKENAGFLLSFMCSHCLDSLK